MIFFLFSSLIWLILYWYCKEKFSLGHSWEFKGGKKEPNWLCLPSYHKIWLLYIRALFDWLLKFIRDCTLPWWWLVRKLRPLSQPIRYKLKPIKTWSPTYFCTLGSLVSFTLSSHWLCKINSFLPISPGICFSTGNSFMIHSWKGPYWKFSIKIKYIH